MVQDSEWHTAREEVPETPNVHSLPVNAAQQREIALSVSRSSIKNQEYLWKTVTQTHLLLRDRLDRGRRDIDYQ